MEKFETSWMTFTLAAVVIVGATILLYTGKIGADVWQWSITTAVGAYAVKSAVGKIMTGISNK